jgi:hypothetical protein
MMGGCGGNIVRKSNSWLTALAVLSLLLLCVIFSGCGGGDDLGTCTIKKSGDDVVIKDISLEECQERFGNEPGATGWEWEPNS